MQRIPQEQVQRRLQTENPWWSSATSASGIFEALRPRAYLDLLLPLVERTDVKRAILLMGPRRVGKTVLIHHVISSLIASGVPPRSIAYVSVDHPIYNGCGLDDLMEHVRAASGSEDSGGQRFVFFDEIQYLRDWEIHLKVLVDGSAGVKFIASGSAAAALRLRSHESGAGRFTDFLLPPLTFHEYLHLLGKSHLIATDGEASAQAESALRPTVHTTTDIASLNDAFIHYLNFGGYPEVIFSPAIQSDPGRFIKADIIDKVLLRDLPGLYGIQDIQELNYLFTTLAYNTAQEVSLEQISQSSGVAKNTIKRYIEYLEAAFLLKIVHRIDRSGKRFLRANFFKVYLTNPSMRAALFSPIDASDDAVGSLAETGIFSQWFHHPVPQFYARWNNGEVDIVGLDVKQKPSWAVEVKWTDRYVERPAELKSLIQFCHANDLKNVTVTSRTRFAERQVEGITLNFVPASLYCYSVGLNLVRGKHAIATWADLARHPVPAPES